MRETIRKNYLSLLNSPEFKALQQQKNKSPSQAEHVQEVVDAVAKPPLQSQDFEDLLNERDEAWLDPPGKKYAQLQCLNSSNAK